MSECKTELTYAITNLFFCLRKNWGSLFWESLQVNETKVCGGIKASCKVEIGNFFVKWFMIGASATYLLVNICCTLLKFFSESDKKICEFVSSNCAEEPVKSLPSRSLYCTKSVIKTSCMNETVLPLFP
jgi:hypothetical protein